MFKVNKNNNVEIFDEVLSKQSITSEIAYKYPFKFNVGHLDLNYNISNIDSSENMQEGKNCKKQLLDYQRNSILEPYVSHSNSAYQITLLNEKSYSNMVQHLHYRNFYFSKKGTVNIILVHPQYVENFIKENEISTSKKNLKYLKQNKNFVHVQLKKDEALFVPNYWIVFVENNHSKESIFYLIQYKSLMNELCFLKKKIWNN
jgi:hypothetical protein